MEQPVSRRLAILLVEDEDLVRELAAEALTDQGFDVMEAPNGSTALDLVEKGAPVDVLFTDVNMPGEPDGIALAESVCALRPKTRVLVASGRPLPVAVLPCKGRFLTKPYEMLGLGRVINELTR